MGVCDQAIRLTGESKALDAKAAIRKMSPWKDAITKGMIELGIVVDSTDPTSARVSARFESHDAADAFAIELANAVKAGLKSDGLFAAAGTPSVSYTVGYELTAGAKVRQPTRGGKP